MFSTRRRCGHTDAVRTSHILSHWLQAPAGIGCLSHLSSQREHKAVNCIGIKTRAEGSPAVSVDLTQSPAGRAPAGAGPWAGCPAGCSGTTSPRVSCSLWGERTEDRASDEVNRLYYNILSGGRSTQNCKCTMESNSCSVYWASAC